MASRSDNRHYTEDSLKKPYWIVMGVVLFVGWFLAMWIGRPMYQTARLSSAPPTPTPFVRYSAPIPDPDSDIIIGGDSYHWDLVRYSPQKGFWGFEKGIANSFGMSPPIVAGGYILYFEDYATKAPRLVSYDLSADRPWPALSVTQFNYEVKSFLYQPQSRRLITGAINQINFYHALRVPPREAGSIAVDFHAGSLFAGADDNHIYSCDWGQTQACYLLEVSDTREDDVRPAVLLNLKRLPIDYQLQKLVFTSDGKLAIATTFLEKKIHVYRVKATGELIEVAGSPFPAEHAPSRLFLHPSEKYIYVGFQPMDRTERYAGLDIYSLDAHRGRVTLARTLNQTPTFLRFASPTVAYASAPVSACDVDTETGVPTCTKVSSMVTLGVMIPSRAHGAAAVAAK